MSSSSSSSESPSSSPDTSLSSYSSSLSMRSAQSWVRFEPEKAIGDSKRSKSIHKLESQVNRDKKSPKLDQRATTSSLAQLLNNGNRTNKTTYSSLSSSGNSCSSSSSSTSCLRFLVDMAIVQNTTRTIVKILFRRAAYGQLEGRRAPGTWELGNLSRSNSAGWGELGPPRYSSLVLDEWMGGRRGMALAGHCRGSSRAGEFVGCGCRSGADAFDPLHSSSYFSLQLCLLS